MPALLPTLPHDASLHGHRVDEVLDLLTVTTGMAFAVLAGIFLVAVLFHRGRAREARYTHGNGRRDRLTAAVAGAVVLFGIDAVAVVKSTSELRAGFWRTQGDEPGALRVEVTAQQWAWTFRYPGADDVFGTADDVVTLNDLRVPAHRSVRLQLTSKDVVHGFYLPSFRTKLDAIPGAVTRLGFEATETGVFEIGCAQHCGAWHYRMRGELTVTDAESFSTWLRRLAADNALRAQAASGAPAAPAGAAAGGSPPAAAASAEANLADGWPWKSAP